jgi:hypothetical protein
MMNKILALTALFILITISGCVSVQSMYSGESEPGVDYRDPKIEVESLRFFVAGQSGLDKKDRVYNSSFREGSVNWLWYELIVRNLSDTNSKMTFREIWLDENNGVIHSEKKEMKVRKKDVYLEYCAGIAAEWKPGYYVLRLFQDSLKIAEKEVKITKIK